MQFSGDQIDDRRVAACSRKLRGLVERIHGAAANQLLTLREGVGQVKGRPFTRRAERDINVL